MPDVRFKQHGVHVSISRAQGDGEVLREQAPIEWSVFKKRFRPVIWHEHVDRKISSFWLVGLECFNGCFGQAQAQRIMAFAFAISPPFRRAFAKVL